MNFDLTRQSLFSTIFYFTLLTAIFWGVTLIQTAQPTPINIATDNQILDSIYRFFSYNLVFTLVASSILTLVNSLYVTRLTIRNVVFLERSYMPAMVYLLISSGYYNSSGSLQPLISSLLILVASSMIMRSYSIKNSCAGVYLMAGFCFGAACVIYIPSAIMAPLLFIGLAMFRLIDLREWIAALFGLLFPLFLLCYICWFMGGEFIDPIISIWGVLTTADPTFPQWQDLNILEMLFISVVMLLVVLSVVAFIRKSAPRRPRAAKAYYYFVIQALVLIAGVLVMPCRSLYQLPLLAGPLAVIIPSYFNLTKPSFVTNFIYTLVLGSAIAMHLVSIFE